jgi:Na+-driven multidrug efflux pump
VVNLHLENSPLLIDRYGDNLSLVPSSPLQAASPIDPRWYNLPLFLLLTGGGTVLLARLFFREKEAWRYVALAYLALTLLAGLISGLGWAFHSPMGYTLGQHLKELILSPLLSLLLLAALYMQKQLLSKG